MNFKCIFGHLWGDPNEGRQACKKCNKVRNIACNHVWKAYDRLHQSKMGLEKGYVVIKECENCGKLKSFDFTI